MAKVLIAGCGYVGASLGERLAADGDKVWGLRRQPLSLPRGVRPLAADLSIPSSLIGLPTELDVVLYMVSPSGSEDALYRAAYVDGLRHLLDALASQGQSPSRVLFVSSSAVYAQGGGEWVDEGSPTEPRHFSGRRLLEAERLLLDGPFPGTVVRLGGIYGPRRTQLIDRVRRGRAVYRSDPPQYTNRIHRDDCAGVLHHLMRLAQLESVYLGVDCEPASEQTVLNWLAGALGAPPPRPAVKGEARPARGNKRCRNERLLASGYRFRYPTFREGYRGLVAAAS